MQGGDSYEYYAKNKHIDSAFLSFTYRHMQLVKSTKKGGDATPPFFLFV